ncbi:uncharacterized protein ARMOST_13603 [Armillaria ostoyae]|uniref:Uncharacterized protein n=1 Tax=Armillaria ostoyae TaxID=47428 RepID=A0A284RN74_ARMOS|nr:uncharacterized protein ARMOST_13603 [Armillaria ostoyae]
MAPQLELCPDDASTWRFGVEGDVEMALRALRVVGVPRVVAIVTFSSKTMTISSSKKILRLPFSLPHLGPVNSSRTSDFPKLAAARWRTVSITNSYRVACYYPSPLYFLFASICLFVFQSVKGA